MSTMLTPARPSASATSATTPGRFGTDDAQLVHRRRRRGRPPAARRRSSRAASFQAPTRRGVAGRPARRAPRRSRATASSIASTSASRVGEVDVGPDRGRWRRRRASRRGSSARSRGSRSPSSAPAAWATSTLASTCGRCETAAIRRSCVSASIAAGRAPSVGEQPVQALVEHALGARGRRQVPGRAVEQVGPRVLDPGRLGARERVPADEARVVDRRDQLALGRADVGDHAVRRARRPAPRATAPAARRPARRRTRPRRRRAPRPSDAHAVPIAPRSSAASEHPGRRVEAAHLGAEPLARGEPDRPADQPDAEDRDRIRRSSNGGERLAGDRGRPLDLLDVVGEVVGVERLRPVADRLLGVAGGSRR